MSHEKNHDKIEAQMPSEVQEHNRRGSERSLADSFAVQPNLAVEAAGSEKFFKAAVQPESYPGGSMAWHQDMVKRNDYVEQLVKNPETTKEQLSGVLNNNQYLAEAMSKRVSYLASRSTMATANMEGSIAL